MGHRPIVRRHFAAGLGAVVFAALASPALAQWPDYPTPNVPRNADGTPNMKAPTPRTKEGHPDFTGLWEIYLNSIAAAPPPGQASPSRSLQDQSGGGDANQLGLAPSTPPDDPKAPPRATFFDIGANIKGGAPYQPWAK